MMGVVGATPAGYSAAMFYAITYAITTLAAFGVLSALARGGQEAQELTDLAGLAKRNRLLAVVMLNQFEAYLKILLLLDKNSVMKRSLR